MANLAELLISMAQIAVATSPSDVWPQLRDLGIEFGGNLLFAFAYQPVGKALVVRPLYSDDLEIAAMAVSVEELQTDPVLVRAYADTNAFALKDVVDQQCPFVRLLSKMAAGGEAFVVPVGDGKMSGVVVFAGRHLDLTAMARTILRTAAYTALTRAFALETQGVAKPVERSNGLSARESECLHWATIGKTDCETATILGISARTVRFHITNAKTKLGVNTRIQAVTMVLRAIAERGSDPLSLAANTFRDRPRKYQI